MCDFHGSDKRSTTDSHVARKSKIVTATTIYPKREGKNYQFPRGTSWFLLFLFFMGRYIT